MKSFCEENDIAFIDLSAEFWKVEDTNKLYLYPWDNHLSPEGHELVAVQFYQLIKNILRHIE